MTPHYSRHDRARFRQIERDLSPGGSTVKRRHAREAWKREKAVRADLR